MNKNNKKSKVSITRDERHEAGKAQMISYIESQYIGWHYVAIESIKKIILNSDEFYSDFNESQPNSDLFTSKMVNVEIYNAWLYEALSHAEQAIEDLFSIMKKAQNPDWFARDVVVYNATEIKKYIWDFIYHNDCAYVCKQFQLPDLKKSSWKDESEHEKYKNSVNTVVEYIIELAEFHQSYYFDYCQYKHGLAVMLRDGGKNNKDPLNGVLKSYDSRSIEDGYKGMKNIPAIAMKVYPETAKCISELEREGNFLHYTPKQADIDNFLDITGKAYSLLYVFRKNLMYSCENEDDKRMRKYAFPSGDIKTFYTITVPKEFLV